MKRYVLSVLSFSLWLFAYDFSSLDSVIYQENQPNRLTFSPTFIGQKAIGSATNSGGIHPISNFTFNEATDSISAVNNANGELVYYLVYRKQDGARNLVYFGTGFNLLSPEIVAYYNQTVWNSNSYGGWVYFDSTQGGFGNGCTFASRNGSNNKVFHFTLKPTGILSIVASITPYSTGEVKTTTPLPLNEWVYIQGYQSGRDYQVGWKKLDGTQEIASGSIIPQNTFLPFAYHFNTCAHRSSYFFWTPGEPMLANYEPKNMNNAEWRQGRYYHLDNTLLTDLNNAITGTGNTPLQLNMFDIYADNNGTVLVIDLRNIGYADLPK